MAGNRARASSLNRGVARTHLLLVVTVMPACAVLNDVQREERWDAPVYFEVSRSSAGLVLQVEPTDAGVFLSVAEHFDCIEEATQLGAQSVYAKPKDAVLLVGGVLVSAAVAGAIAFGAGAAVDAVLERRRDDVNPENPDPVLQTWQQPRSVTSQLVTVGVGILGVGSQLLITKKIIGWLKAISFEEHRPLSRELGRKVHSCDRLPRSGRLRGPRLPPEGLELKPRAKAPADFLPRDGLTLDGEPVRP